MGLKLLYILSALDIMNLSLFIITFAPHVRKIGGTHSEIGIIMSSCALIGLFWNPIAGSMGDNSGRKGILLKCLGITLLGNVLMVLFSDWFAVVFLSRLICAFGAPSGTLIRTLVTDMAKDKDEKANAMNKIGGLSAALFMVGALSAGFINELPDGVKINFGIITINVLISLACAWKLPTLKQKKASKDDDKKQNSNQLTKAFQTLKEIEFNKYWQLFAIKLCIDLCYGVMQSNLGLILATTFEIRGRQMGYVMTLFSVFGMATNFAMIRLRKTLYADDDGFMRLQHGGTLLIVAFGGLGLTTYFPLFMSFVPMMSIARTLIDSTLTDVLTNQTSDKDKGGIMSLFESILALTGMVSPLISGLIADKYGEQTPILLCTLPALLGTTIAMAQKNKPKAKTS